MYADWGLIEVRRWMATMYQILPTNNDSFSIMVGCLIFNCAQGIDLTQSAGPLNMREFDAHQANWTCHN